ncbi:class I SAM-dependent methyltransferase [Nocardia iowensis]|uniref:S-adenosyl-L-methionine-dependent methyltransferase n=1 Tax=Nocardia iowensis TaxID=204891 RepID=A0ABX8RUW3_NOCIO|nr:class I SAM-dependent methyltransferase [Nocardia iowensis]QXN93036.1 class I SAM-dependent methyltransferase [Nocardia iowensis]
MRIVTGGRYPELAEFPGHMEVAVQVGQPSRTALSVALVRATHQSTPSPRVFDDPLAVRLVGLETTELTASSEYWIPEQVHPWIVTRFRFAEDAIGAAVATGTRQVVILGAGLETFAYRNPYPDLRVFEVDHPRTQEWKRLRLREADIRIPPSLTFVPADFEREPLGVALARAGFDRGAATIFVCLGVVVYLTEQAALDMLSFTAGLDAPTQVIVDYNDLPTALPPDRRATLASVMQRVAERGEPWQCFFPPDELAQQLRSMGFTEIADSAVPELLARYGFEPSAANDPFAAHILHAARR